MGTLARNVQKRLNTDDTDEHGSKEVWQRRTGAYLACGNHLVQSRELDQLTKIAESPVASRAFVFARSATASMAGPQMRMGIRM